MSSHTPLLGIKLGRSMAVLPLAAVDVMADYWVAWFTRRSLLPVEPVSS
jgi:hypothetical protein